MSDLSEKLFHALNKLTKWRSVFASWQLGSRMTGDPECDAVRDHREVTILLRCEVNAITRILVDKGIITEEDFQKAMIEEAALLERDYEERFPGVRATETGIQFDTLKASETMKHWRI